MFKNIQNAWYDFSWIFIRKYQQIKRLIGFFPIVWNGYDFSYSYALDIFKYQLQRTADLMESDRANTQEAKNTASRIRTAIKLIENVYETEVYRMEYFDTMEKLYGKLHMDFVLIDEKSKDGQNLYEMKSWYENGVDETHQKEIKKVESQMRIYCQQKHDKANRILWAFVAHNIENWWD